MKLYVCWNTKQGPLGHPCGNAYAALKEAGHDPEVIKARGLRLLPDVLNRSEARLEVQRLTGKKAVPVLVTDTGDVVSDSKRIVAWARAPGGGLPGPLAGLTGAAAATSGARGTAR